MYRTANFYHCTALPIIRSIKVDRTVNFYYCTALPVIRTVLKNINKYWSYNRNLRVGILTLLNAIRMSAGGQTGDIHSYVLKVCLLFTMG